MAIAISRLSTNTAFFYLRHQLMHKGVLSKHRIGAIAIAPSTDPNKIIVSIFIANPNKKVQPSYMKTAAIGRLNSTKKFVEVDISRGNDGELDAEATMSSIISLVGISEWLDTKYGVTDENQFADLWTSGLAGAYKNMLKSEKATA